MLIGNIRHVKLQVKKSKSALLFFLLLATYNKEELMAYVSSPQNKKLPKYMSVFLFFLLQKRKKEKCKSAILAFPFL